MITVLIAAADLLPTLAERAGSDGELLTFPDTDALRALETIVKRRPNIVALERVFAATPRGAALIKRIKADPALAAAEIRVIAQDASYSRVSRPAAPSAPAGAAAVAVVPAATLGADPAPVAPLDQRGTRRAPRFVIGGDLPVQVDGNPARLVDLSSVGAQVVSPTILKPNQRVRLVLSDELGAIRINAVIAWASFEIPPKSGPRYRAGLDFLDGDAAAVDAFSTRHRAEQN